MTTPAQLAKLKTGAMTDPDLVKFMATATQLDYINVQNQAIAKLINMVQALEKRVDLLENK